MQSTQREKIIGLDIGQTSARAIVLARTGKTVTLTQSAQLNFLAEGILDGNEDEQLQAVAHWLKELKTGVQEVALGMPQYMGTTQVSDFAPGAKDADLARMVEYETLQLGSLSDGEFIYGYHAMPPGNGRQNPVMIGGVREENLNQFVDRATAAGIAVDDVSLYALAMVNAWLELNPAERTAPAPQALLNVGVNEATLAIVSGGQVLYIGGIEGGGRAFTQALARKRGLSELDAEKLKCSGEVSWHDWAREEESAVLGTQPASGRLLSENQEGFPTIRVPMDADGRPTDEHEDEVKTAEILGRLACFRNFRTRFEENVAIWRDNEREPLKTTPLSAIWLCGGGAKMRELVEYLSETQSCPCRVFGPELTPAGGADPEAVLAFGQALQGIGQAMIPVSLLPRHLKWLHDKQNRFKYLVAACILLFVSLFGAEIYSYCWLRSAREELAIQQEELDLCLKKMPELDKMQEALAYYQSRMVPFVDRGYRVAHFMQSFNELQKALNSGDWCVYVADKASYDEYKIRQEKERLKEQISKEPHRARTMFERRAHEDIAADKNQEENRRMTVMAIEPLTTMVAIGFTKKQVDPKTKREIGNFDTMLAIQNRLNRKAGADAVGTSSEAVFAGVDSMPISEQSGREAAVLERWYQYLENSLVDRVQTPYILGTQYSRSPFILKLPFKERDVIPPPPPPPKAKGRGKRGQETTDTGEKEA